MVCMIDTIQDYYILGSPSREILWKQVCKSTKLNFFKPSSSIVYYGRNQFEL